jgi:hypothetical protein
MRKNRSRLRLEPQQPQTFEYNGPIDILRSGRPCLQITRIEDLPRTHRLIQYINPKSDTRYYVIDDRNIKGLHFNKEVLVRGLRITRKGDQITITRLDDQPETHAEFTPAERKTEPVDRLALKEFSDLEARLRSAASTPEELPQVIALQMELREKYEDLLERADITSVLDRIQGLILVASGAIPSDPVASAAAHEAAPAAADEPARPPSETDSGTDEILSLLRKARSLEEEGDEARSRKALEEADRRYLAGIDRDAEDRLERVGRFAEALEADAAVMRFLSDKDWPLLKRASIRLQEAEARRQEPLARKELTEIRDGFIELTGRKLSGKKELIQAQKDYQALRKREKKLYVELLIKPDGKYRSTNIWQGEYPESYRTKMQGLATLRDDVLISKAKAKKKLTSGGTRDT